MVNNRLRELMKEVQKRCDIDIFFIDKNNEELLRFVSKTNKDIYCEMATQDVKAIKVTFSIYDDVLGFYYEFIEEAEEFGYHIADFINNSLEYIKSSYKERIKLNKIQIDKLERENIKLQEFLDTH